MKEFEQYGLRKDEEWEWFPWLPWWPPETRPPFKIRTWPEDIAPFFFVDHHPYALSLLLKISDGFKTDTFRKMGLEGSSKDWETLVTGFIKEWEENNSGIDMFHFDSDEDVFCVYSQYIDDISLFSRVLRKACNDEKLMRMYFERGTKELNTQKTDIEFRKITEFPRGTLEALLKDSYSFEPKFERDWHKQWQEFDDFFYNNPHIAEFSGFMTVLEGKPIGFASWNPTNLPESAEVGHNCILTEYKGNGYGKRQMQEAVQRIIAQGTNKIVVWTSETCVPAQHTYESTGFQFVKKCAETFHSEYSGQRIYYEMIVN